jgi:hypothetical protein
MEKPTGLHKLLTGHRPSQHIHDGSNTINSDDDFPIATVFQSSPLGLRSTKEKQYLRLPELSNLREERDILTKAFESYPGGIDFRIGTLDSIKSFLQNSQSKMVHFSTHGSPGFLIVEDAWGGGVFLDENILRELVTQNKPPPVVVLAACNTRSIGEVFIRAGSEHVICTVDNDTDVTSGCAMAFSSVLYRNLLEGRSIGDAFEKAGKWVAAFSEEVQPFCLLPERNVSTNSADDPHQEKIFAKKDGLLTATFSEPSPLATGNRKENTSPSSSRKMDPPWCSPCSDWSMESNLASTPPSHNLSRIHPFSELGSGNFTLLQRNYIHPHPPQLFERADVEQYRILRAIGEGHRIGHEGGIVWVTGAEGCGKAAVMQAICAYLQDRMAINGLDGIFWTRIPQSNYSGIKGNFFSLIESILKIPPAPPKRFQIVVDARKLPKETGHQVATSLRRLFQERPSTTIVVIHRPEDSRTLQIGQFRCVEHKISVPELNFEGTVKLFGNYSHHVHNHTSEGIHSAKLLWRYMEPPTADGGYRYQSRPIEYNVRDCDGTFTYTAYTSSMISQLPNRYAVIFKMLGEGFPDKIRSAAKHMNEDDYKKIVHLSKYDELDRSEYQSHNGLLRLQLTVSQDIVNKLRRHPCCPSIRLLQMKFDCISMVKQEVKDLQTLRNNLDGIMISAQRIKDWGTISNLRTQLEDVTQRLQAEVDAVWKAPTPFARIDDEALDKSYQKQCFMESVLHHVQEVMAKATTHLTLPLGVRQSKDSMESTSTEHSMDSSKHTVDSVLHPKILDSMLRRAEEMLQIVISVEMPQSLVSFQGMIHRSVARRTFAWKRILYHDQQQNRDRSLPFPSNQENNLSNLDAFFGPTLPRRNKNSAGYTEADKESKFLPTLVDIPKPTLVDIPKPTLVDIPKLTKKEITNRRLLRGRVRIYSIGCSPSHRVPTAGAIQKACGYPGRESVVVPKKRLSSATANSTLPSVSTTPTRPTNIFCRKEITSEARWSSPLISPSPSQQSLSRHSLRSSISNMGSFHPSRTSSFDSSPGMNARARQSSIDDGVPVRFIESHLSLGSIGSVLSAGTYSDNDNVMNDGQRTDSRRDVDTDDAGRHEDEERNNTTSSG